MTSTLSLSNVVMSSVLPYLGAAVGIGLTFAVLYYFFSKILNSPEIEAKSKEYLWLNIENIVIIGGIFVINAIIVNFIAAMYGASPQMIDHITVAKQALYKFEELFILLYEKLFVLHIFVATTANLSLFVKVSLAGYTGGLSTDMTMMPLAGLENIYEQIDELMMSIMEAFSFVIARSALLSVAPYLFVGLLPLGLLLRAFPLTKTTGSSIIALVLVIYYVYPMSVLVSDNLLFNIVKFRSFSGGTPTLDTPRELPYSYSTFDTLPSDYNAVSQPNDFNATVEETSKEIKENVSLIKVFWSFFKSKELLAALFTNLFSIIANALGIGILEKIGLFTVYLTTLPTFGYIGVAYNVLVNYMFYVVQVVFVAVILLLFEITISVTMFRNISTIIGGETRLLGLSKLV